MTRYVAFLRAINVGGTGIVKMEDLKLAFEKLGYTDVRTLQAAGNVLFSSPKSEATVTKEIETAIARLGAKRAVVRTHEELVKLVKQDPFKGKTPPFDVTILLDPTTQKAQSVPGVGVIRSDKRFVLSIRTPNPGRPIYASQHVEKSLKVAATTRNWNTIVKLSQR